MATVTVSHKQIKPGQVAEVTVVPSKLNADTKMNITIIGERGGLKNNEITTIEVFGGEIVNGDEDPLKVFAAEIRNKFVSWLEINNAEFGVSNETEWEGTLVRPRFLVVTFYLFFSDEWEMGVS